MKDFGKFVLWVGLAALLVAVPLLTRSVRAADGAAVVGRSPRTRASLPSSVKSADEVKLSDTVILGMNSIALGQQADILSGDVVANDSSPGPVLKDNVELSVAQKSDVVAGYALRADSIKLGNQSVIDGDVIFNELDNGGTINGDQISPVPAPGLPFFPADILSPCGAPEPRAAAEDFDIPQKSSLTLAAGEYGDFEMGQQGDLTFTGGEYIFRSLEIGQKSKILFQAASIVRVAGKIDIGQQAVIGPASGSGIAPSDILIIVGGINGTTGALNANPKAAEIAQKSEISANICVPNGTLEIGQQAEAAGSFLARDVDIAQKSEIALDSFFQDRPPTANPQTVITNSATSVEILLTGTDPESLDLSFAIEGAGPAKGALSCAPASPCPAPIVPDPIEDPENPGTFVQPPVTSATITYTPANPDLNEEDMFTFSVTDPEGGVGMAVVTINPFDPSPPPPPVTIVDACPDTEGCQEDVVEGGIVGIGLDAEGPGASTLTFCILGLPTGTLTDSDGADVESVPYALPSPSLTYAAVTAAGTSDSFLFEARDTGSCGDACTSPNCDQATFLIDITEAIALAGEDQQITTDLNQPVLFNVFANSGGVAKSAGAPLSIAKAAFAFPAEIAGGVADAPPEDGSGDIADTPIVVAAGVNVSGNGNPSGSVVDATGDAAPVGSTTLVWTLNSVALDDGGTASGTFEFNATTQTAVDWDISTTAGSTMGAFNYTPANSTFSSFDAGDPQNRLSFSHTGSTRQFRMTPTQAITGSGGSIALDLNTGGGGAGGVECFNCAPFRLITAGSISAPAAAPSPDITSVSLTSDGTNLDIDIRFDGPTLDPLATGAWLYLDIDQDTATGCDIDEDALACTPGASDDPVGWEYRVQIPKPQSGFDTNLTAQVAHFDTIGLFSDVPFTLESDGFTLSVPLTAIGGDNNGVDFLAESFLHSGPNPSPGNAAPSDVGLDFAPDLSGAPGTAQGDLAGTVRTQIEFDISTLGTDETAIDSIDSAIVTLTTEKGANDSVDTLWFIGDDDGDGLLTPSDFEASSSPLANVAMPVPAGPVGTEGTFSFSVLGEIRAARLANPPRDFLTIQGRVDENLVGFNQGLQVRTTTAPSGQPILGITTPPPPPPPPLIEILSLPLLSQGTITTLAGVPVAVGSTFLTGTTLLFTPASGFSGTAQLSYQVTEGLVVDTALVDFIVSLNDPCAVVGRPPGCSPDNL